MNILWRIANKLYKLGFAGGGHFFKLIQCVLYANSVSAKCTIGAGTIFYHRGLGCVVHGSVVIGNNCTVFQNVTMGSKWSNGICKGGAPIIGNNVLIGAGAVILGNIRVGNNVIIGANAVILQDIPDDSIAIGVPAKIKKRGL
ncbi:MAG: hypothetical protein LBJ36_02450 [Synergistaceae bacterium]|nr:hypothetical protein [Synergistaceae bacterium]